MIELFKHLLPLNQENFNWIFDHYGTAIYIVLFLVIFEPIYYLCTNQAGLRRSSDQ